MKYEIEETENMKVFRSPGANYLFNKKTGLMTTWGKTVQDDAEMFPVPTLLDIEITTKCTGVNGKLCSFCFPEGTPILTTSFTKSVPIEKIKKGSTVMTLDEEKWERRYNVVTRVSKRQYDGDLIVLKTRDDEIIKMTPEHPVFKEDWGWVIAEKIQPGDYVVKTIHRDFGIVRVKEVSREPYSGLVYNFECANHSYLANGFWVHNCYKGNDPHGENMSFDTFNSLLQKIPSSVTQIAFGADATLKSNPDVWKIFEATRKRGIVPNVTVAQIDDETADKLVKYCGAVAVSRYADKDACYDSVFKLTSRGMKQVNIHLMISEETYDRAMQTIKDCATDPRLKDLRALVFLSLKQKGRGLSFTPLSDEHFKALAEALLEVSVYNGVKIGFDSCSSCKACSAFNSIDPVLLEHIQNSIIPCESTLESGYINVHGEFFPCSFVEGEKDWEVGVNVLSSSSLEKVWLSPRVQAFRKKLQNSVDKQFSVRICPYFKI